MIDVAWAEVRHLVVKGVVQFSNEVDFDEFVFTARTIQVLVSFLLKIYFLN